jgi:hypothetical protein
MIISHRDETCLLGTNATNWGVSTNSSGVFLEANDLDIQHCENDKSQGAGEYRKFAVVASRRLIGRSISIGHKDLLGP